MKYPDFSEAACAGVGTEFFYPSDVNKAYIDLPAAIRICKGCPIREQCLEWGVHHEANGIWGGTTPNLREKIRRKAGIVFSDPMYGLDN